ncbi:MAG: hypothetical protein ACM3W7_13140, partial [Acidobacteriota bacterium]
RQAQARWDNPYLAHRDAAADFALLRSGYSRTLFRQALPARSFAPAITAPRVPTVNARRALRSRLVFV